MYLKAYLIYMLITVLVKCVGAKTMSRMRLLKHILQVDDSLETRNKALSTILGKYKIKTNVHVAR